MIGLAYLLLLGPLVLWASDSGCRAWPLRASYGQMLAARAGATAVSALVALLGIWVVQHDGEGGPWSTPFLGASLSLGGCVFLVGLALWRGRVGLALRGAGWLAMVFALAVPSTATLLLVLVGPMIFLLSEIPAERERGPVAA